LAERRDPMSRPSHPGNRPWPAYDAQRRDSSLVTRTGGERTGSSTSANWPRARRRRGRRRSARGGRAGRKHAQQPRAVHTDVAEAIESRERDVEGLGTPHGETRDGALGALRPHPALHARHRKGAQITALQARQATKSWEVPAGPASRGARSAKCNDRAPRPPLQSDCPDRKPRSSNPFGTGVSTPRFRQTEWTWDVQRNCRLAQRDEGWFAAVRVRSIRGS
jgi:hypothetical protein